MVSKLRRIIRDRRVLILLVAVLIAFIAINPNPWREGVTIRNVEQGSAADLIGMKSGQDIIAIDNQLVKSVADYARLTSNLQANDTVVIETEKNFFKLTVPLLEAANDSQQAAKNTLGLTVAKKPKTNIKTGLDLQGGTRVLLQPEEKISDVDLELLIENMNRRLNLFGLSDVIVRDASDFSGQQYIMVEIAGVNEEEVKELVSKQGKFEAKVGNVSVFKGTDVIDVCRSAQCSGIDYQAGGCQQFAASEWVCPFFFSITLSQE